jgi:rod shape-determining protein MreD
MRWTSFFILAYMALGLQTGISAAMQWQGAGPNLVLIAVVFVAMNAPREAALLSAFLLGAMQDLTSQGAMGLYSFSYGLAAIMVASGAKNLYREHPLTHVTLTLAAGILTAAVLSIHGWLRLRPAGEPFTPLFYTAVYSAILAPFVLGLLQRGRRIFRFQRGRRPARIAGGI